MEEENPENTARPFHNIAECDKNRKKLSRIGDLGNEPPCSSCDLRNCTTSTAHPAMSSYTEPLDHLAKWTALKLRPGAGPNIVRRARGRGDGMKGGLVCKYHAGLVQLTDSPFETT